MEDMNKTQRVKITKDGPYIVSGSIPLKEKIITPSGKCSYEFKDGRELPQAEKYALCRCGKSHCAPFCDGAHTKTGFIGDETAENSNYTERAVLIEGPGIDLLDDNRCALARFCHREKGDAWELTAASYDDETRDEAVKAASECPAGRLTAVLKNGVMIEPEYEPEVDILQDQEEGVSGGIFVKGKVRIESSRNEEYEARNRIVLCRCGKSANKPFCDGSHVSIKFSDKA